MTSSLVELPPRVKDITGQIFGRWTVISFAGINRQARWLCRCECGNERVVSGGNLRCGGSTQCNKCQNVIHGMSDSAEYGSWSNMIHRCTNPKDPAYANYGGRSITVCDSWRNSFENFYADMGPKPGPEYSVERENNALGYFPGNCVWATRREQSNNMRTNRIIEFNGRSMTLANWARAIDIKYGTLRMRLNKYGWSIERALTTPVRRRRAPEHSH